MLMMGAFSLWVTATNRSSPAGYAWSQVRLSITSVNFSASEEAVADIVTLDKNRSAMLGAIVAIGSFPS
jgi:hypothetical protein